MSKLTRCAFDGCHKTSVNPVEDGWSYLAEWGPGVRDGFYCKPHVDALEALLVSGELHSDDDHDEEHDDDGER